jgi:hypothetical protein
MAMSDPTALPTPTPPSASAPRGCAGGVFTVFAGLGIVMASTWLSVGSTANDDQAYAAGQLAAYATFAVLGGSFVAALGWWHRALAGAAVTGLIIVFGLWFAAAMLVPAALRRPSLSEAERAEPAIAARADGAWAIFAPQGLEIPMPSGYEQARVEAREPDIGSGRADLRTLSRSWRYHRNAGGLVIVSLTRVPDDEDRTALFRSTIAGIRRTTVGAGFAIGDETDSGPLDHRFHLRDSNVRERVLGYVHAGWAWQAEIMMSSATDEDLAALLDRVVVLP